MSSDSLTLRIFIGELTILIPILVAMGIERLRPIDPVPVPARFNVVYAVLVTLFSATVLQPAAGVEIAFIASRFGQPPIPLPNDGWRILASALALLAFKDFLDYWFHRAQHHIRALWSMHSFHHSDDAMNVTTAQRHFWLDRVLFVCVTYLPIGMVFRFGGQTALIFSLGAMFFSLFPHMNLRIELGRFSWIATGPQLHRTHHSVLTEHHNANYAGIFPVWDVLFGTYIAPRPLEFPSTGIGERPPDRLGTALIWPFREQTGR